jgi:hypothetical protein
MLGNREDDTNIKSPSIRRKDLEIERNSVFDDVPEKGVSVEFVGKVFSREVWAKGKNLEANSIEMMAKVEGVDLTA